MIINATGERRFFQMKHVKNAYRLIETQEIPDMFFVVIKYDILRDLKYTDVVEKCIFKENTQSK